MPSLHNPGAGHGNHPVESKDAGAHCIQPGAARLADLRVEAALAGTGQLDYPDDQDVYSFLADPGQRLYFHAQSGDNCALRLRWRCVDGQGSVLFDQLLGASGPCGPGDPGTVTLTNGGSYTLTVYGVADETGAYQFQLQAR